MFGFGFSLTKLASKVDLLVQGIRASISGKNLILPGETKCFGTNQGNWGDNYEPDAALIKGMGLNVVRTLLRRRGDYPANTDSANENASDTWTNPAYWAKFMQELDWLEAQGLWIIVALDTNYGAGTRGLGNSDWNFFDTLDTVNRDLEWERFCQVWERIVRENHGRQRILCWELIPEPMDTGSNSSHGPILKAKYLELMNRLRVIDPTTPFLIGGRASYSLNTIAEVLFPERNDVIYTPDFLTNKTSTESTFAAQIELLTSFRDTHNKPVLIQQIGRNTSDDDGDGSTTENPGLTALNGAMFMCRAHNIAITHWQFHQNSTSPLNYSLWYKINAGVNSAENWAPKTAEINSMVYHAGITSASLEAAAIAAATACGGELFYVKSDLSNVFQNSAGTTPVTAVGQPIGRVNAVVGSRFFQQTTDALRPTLATSVNGYAVGFLPAAESWLSCDQAYFAPADTTQTVIVAARPPVSASNRNLMHCGTSGSVIRWPNLVVTATDECQASWRGDDNVLQSTSTVTTCDNRAIVATASMSALNNKRVCLNGVQEGTTNTTPPGTVTTTPTRLRWGAATTGANGIGGPSQLIFICKNAVTDEQRRHIERWGAWLVGSPFRGAIPAA